MKEKIFLSPSRYIQGTDILKDIPDYVSRLGTKLLLLTSQGNHRRLQENISSYFRKRRFFHPDH